MAEVSGRRADELGDFVGVLELGAIDLDAGARVAEQGLGNGFDDAGLAGTGGPKKKEIADGAAGRVQGGKLYLPPSLLKICEPFGSYGAPCPSSFFMRRSAFDRVGGSEESFNPGTYQSFEDKAFLTKMYLSVPTFVDGSCLDRYRCRSNSMWHSVRGTKLEELERRFYFRWVRRYLVQQCITDREIWKSNPSDRLGILASAPSFGYAVDSTHSGQIRAGVEAAILTHIKSLQNRAFPNALC